MVSPPSVLAFMTEGVEKAHQEMKDLVFVTLLFWFFMC